MLSTPARYFVAVAKSGSFTKSAQSLYVSQPTLSKQIARLEEALGIPLLERTTRDVKLTPQGRVLYRTLVANMEAWDKALSTARMLERNLEKTLNVGLLYGWRLNRLPTDGFSRFQERYPFVELNVAKHTYNELSANLKNGRLDIIFTLEEEIKGEKEWLEYTPVFSDKLILYFSSSHPITKTANIWEHLDGMRLYMMDEKASRSTVPSISDFIRQKRIPMTVHPCPNFETMITAVDQKKGGAITALSSAVCESPSYRYYDFGLDIQVVCAWRRDNGKNIVDHFLGQFIS